MAKLFLPGTSKQYDLPLEGLSQQAEISVGIVFVLLLAIVILPALWEELVFRGVLAGWLEQRYSPLVTAVVGSVLFALLHGRPSSMITLLVSGLLAYWLRRFHRNLVAPILAHAVNNAVVFVAVLTLA